MDDMADTLFLCKENLTIFGNTSHSRNVTLAPNGSLDCMRRLPDVCNEPVRSLDIFIALFLLFVMILGTLGNSLVVLAVAFSRTLRAQVTNYFLSSLAVSDIMVSLLTLPVKFKQALHNQHFCMSEGSCYFLLLADTVASVASVTHLLVIGIDRFVAITRPYYYPQLATKRRTLVVIACIWIYSLLWAALMLFKWEEPSQTSIKVRSFNDTRFCSSINTFYYTSLISAVFIVPLFIMIITYSVILRVAIKQAKAIAALEVGQKQGQRRKRRELKATSTVMVVFLAFVICWLPNCIITITSLWYPGQFRKLRETSQTLFEFIYITFAQLLPPFNSCLNPLIYAVFNRFFREAFKAVLAKIFNKPTKFVDLDKSAAYWERSARGSLEMSVNFPNL